MGSVGCDVYHLETAVAEHAGEFALSSAYGQATCGIVVADVDGGISSLLIAVAVAFVLVELETAVASGIDVEAQRVGREFGGILQRGSNGDDGPCRRLEGNAAVGCVDA